MERLEFWAPCPRGLEDVLADELRALGVRQVRPLRNGVAFHGGLIDGYRCCLWSRVASRVLLVLKRVDAVDADALYEAVYRLPWQDHIDPQGTIAVDANGVSDALRNTQFTAVKVKDAVCDMLRERSGTRPSVDTHDPDVSINVSLHGAKATIAIDLAGESLHRRAYRGPDRLVGSPLREALAAGILLLADWKGIAEAGGTFMDPMCGYATLPIEAAMIAGDVAPGLMRQHWGFERWLGHDAQIWGNVLDEADEHAEEGESRIPALYASDISTGALKSAATCVKRAGMQSHIILSRADALTLDAPDTAPGLLACEPPYGDRLASPAQLPAISAAFAAHLRGAFADYRIALVTPDDTLRFSLGMPVEPTWTVYSGRTACPIYLLEPQGAASSLAVSADELAPAAAPTVESASAVEPAPAAAASAEPMSAAAASAGPAVAAPAHVASADEPALAPASSAGPLITVGDAEIAVLDRGSDQFAARLRKAYAQRRKWARREKVSCYRVYDADLPDYNVAIDLYQGAGPDEGRRWVHVSEYAAPSKIDPGKAARRFADVLTIIPHVLDVEPTDVFSKIRRHDQGGAQYASERPRAAVMGIVEEDCLLFEVDFTSHLDTGLFLDHRLTRELVFEHADRARFLNLFAYTGTATVHAAAGGAFQTTTVDMSQTYLDWAQRNMERNGFTGPSHEYVRADCVRWISEMRRTANRWDLVFCDPPTFSNSSKMGKRVFDVQRDHAELLIGISRLLTRTGMCIFSCNLRSFQIDADALARAGVVAQDITAETIPPDFERTPTIHHCYIVKRAG